MWEDPIVAEVDRTREMLAAKFNFDIDAIFADMQKRQATLGDRLVSPKTRAEPVAEAHQGRHSENVGADSSEPAQSP
jgi:phage terminase large subunit-like protein